MPEQTNQLQIAQTMIAFVYALKHELRGTDPTADFVRLLARDQAEQLRLKLYKPTALLNEIRHELARKELRAKAGATTLWMPDAQINELGAAVGGSERIASTPIPFSYSVLLHRTVYAYCVMLPFRLVDSTELVSPLLCVFISYALALDAMSRHIERSTLDLCGRPAPESVAPIRL